VIWAALAAGLAAALALSTYVLSRRWERRFPPVGHLVDVEGGRLHVVETTPDADGPAVLLIHGASGNFADPHLALAERLAQRGFRVLAFDRPGHGYSDRCGGDAAEPRRQAALIREAAERLGARRGIVVVHSLAGVLGLAMALDAPEFVRGLVLLSPVSHPWPGGVSWYYHVAAAPVVGPLFRWLVAPYAGPALMTAGLREVFAPNSVPAHYAERTRLALLFRPWQFRANSEDFLRLHGAAVAQAPLYSEIAVPTAIVMGAQDGLVSPKIHARALAREIPGATLALLEGIGHSPHYAATTDVLAAIEDVERRARRLADAAPVTAP
jgi:pimeloyl-ACP methyl ester carboxylesterase